MYIPENNTLLRRIVSGPRTRRHIGLQPRYLRLQPLLQIVTRERP